jgi:Fe-S-cluster-containing hydrogenase component 2
MCLKCVEACPLDAIFIDKSGNRVLKCDVCNGEPRCVEWCPTNALLFITDKG